MGLDFVHGELMVLDKTLIHRLVSLKPFEAALKLSFGPWTVWFPLKFQYMEKILECFHQKP